MGAAIKILIVENNPSDAEFIQYELKKGGVNYLAQVVQNETGYVNALTNFVPDMILSDFALPQFDGNTAFEIRRQMAPETPFIFVSGTIGEEKAVEYIKSGVTDYVLKDKLFTLTVKIERALADVKERREKIEAEDHLKKTLKELQKIMDASLDIICTINEDGKFVRVSEASKRIWGYQPAELIGKKFIDFVFKDDVAKTSIVDTNIMSGIPVTVFENRYMHKNGAIVDMLWSANWDANDKIIYCIAKDITERKKAEKQQEFDRNNLDALINSTNDHMWSVDKDLNLIAFNQQFNQVAMERSPGKIEKGSSIKALHFPAEFEERYKRAFAGEIFTEVDHIITPVERWIEISFYPIREKDEVIGTACYAHDITEEKKAERQLSESEAFSRGTLNALTSHIAVVDRHGRIVRVNESWKRFGAENGETTLYRAAEGGNYFNVCEQSAKAGDQIAAEALKGIKDVIAEKAPSFYFEYPCHSPVEQRWFGMRAMKFESYEPMVVISHLDITVRKRAEENLKHSEAKLKEAQAIAHIGNFEINIANNSETWSDEMFAILGVNKEVVIPSQGLFLSRIHPDDLEAVQTELRESIIKKQCSPLHFRFIRNDGSTRYGYADAVFEFGEDQQPLRIFGILQDVTERKLAEIERTKMVAELIKRNEDLEQFAYIISHNLRAPVANIIGASGLLNDNGLSAEEKRVLSSGISTSVMKLDDVIKDLNRILQVKGKISGVKETVYFSELVGDISSAIKDLIDTNGIEIKCDFSEINEFTTFKPYLYSVFDSLISNSVKYRRQQVHCVIEIRSRLVKNKLQLIFSDNGTGIDLKKNAREVFGLYKRFHTDIEGKGMGLFMVKTQVEAIGGKIAVQSAENEGTEFIIEFET